jgi:prepilin-type N-terminal cleavage/methylation domain-containing protein
MQKQARGRLGGFTLIELLVVVLIIGILAVVALPKYQKAVEKSRGTQALVLLKSFGEAMQTYWLSSGTYPTSFDDLDVDLSGWTGTDKWYTADDSHVLDTRSNGDWSFQMYKDNQGNVSLFMGRISGKYKGGAFGYNALTANGLSTGEMRCYEKISSGVVFGLSSGAFCAQIWKGTEQTAGEGATMRYYTL